MIPTTEPGQLLVDYNRAGCALLEIVSAPDMRSGEEAAAYVRKIQRILRHVSATEKITPYAAASSFPFLPLRSPQVLSRDASQAHRREHCEHGRGVSPLRRECVRPRPAGRRTRGMCAPSFFPVQPRALSTSRGQRSAATQSVARQLSCDLLPTAPSRRSSG